MAAAYVDCGFSSAVVRFDARLEISRYVKRYVIGAVGSGGKGAIYLFFFIGLIRADDERRDSDADATVSLISFTYFLSALHSAQSLSVFHRQ